MNFESCFITNVLTKSKTYKILQKVQYSRLLQLSDNDKASVRRKGALMAP